MSHRKSEKPGNRSFFSNVRTIAVGNGVKYAVSLATFPITTRLFSPEDFGVVSLIISVVTVLATFSFMGLESAIVGSRRIKDSFQLFQICTLGLLATAALSIPVSGIVGAYGAHPLGLWLMLWMPIFIFWFGLRTLLDAMANKLRLFKLIQRRTVVQSLTGAGSMLGLGLLNTGTTGLLLANMVSSGSGVLAVFRRVRAETTFDFFSISFRRLLFVTKKYGSYVRYNWVANLSDVLAVQVTILLMGWFFVPALVGQYSMAMRLVQVPLALLISGIGRAYFERAVREHSDGKLREFLERVLKEQMMIALLITMFFGLFSYELIIEVLGPRWHHSHEILLILLPWVLVWFSSASVGRSTLLVLKKIRSSMMINLAIFFSRLAVVLIGGFSGQWMFAVVGISVVGFFFNGLQLLRATLATGVRWSQVFPLSRILGFAVVLTGAVVCKLLLPVGWISLIAGAAWIGLSGLVLLGLHKRFFKRAKESF